MPPPETGEPRHSPKPQPIGNFPLISLFTICTLCILFILWRRASSIRYVVSHQLKTWTQTDGNIRLSEDDGPPARSFLEDGDEEDDGMDDEPLASRAERLRTREDSPPPRRLSET